MAPPRTKNFHHSWRASSSAWGRNGRTVKPCAASTRAASRTAWRVSGVTGMKPSSSKKPIGTRLQILQRLISEADRRAYRIQRIVSGKRDEEQRDVADSARHGPHGAQDGEGPIAGGEMTAARNTARRGLERAYTGKVCRLAHRASAVAAHSACREAGSNRCRLAAARSAGGSLQIPWVGGALRRVGCRFRRPSETPDSWWFRGSRRRPARRRSTTVAFSLGNVALMQQAASLTPVSGGCDRRLDRHRQAEESVRVYRLRSRAHVPASARAPRQNRPARANAD